MVWKQVLWVALGGSLGSVCRLLGQKWVASIITQQFPYGTLFVNIAGCFLIGIFYGISVRHQFFIPDLRLFLMSGFCGGFTTFSAFTLESMGLLSEQKWIPFLLYLAASVGFGLVSTFSGYFIAR